MDFVPTTSGSGNWVEQYGDYGRDHWWVWLIPLALVLAGAVLMYRMWRSRDDMVNPDHSGGGTWDPWSFRWLWLVLALGAFLGFYPLAQLPHGAPDILRVELVGNRDGAHVLLAHVDKADLGLALLLDGLFILSYVVLIAGLALWAGSYYALAPVRRKRTVIAFAVIGAGACDVVEDVLIWLGAHGGAMTDWHWPWIGVAAMAWAKLAILLGALGFVVAGFWAGWVLRGIRPTLLSEQRLVPKEAKSPESPRPELGIALSGGGIRASSISLGALQVLERTKDTAAPPLGWDQAAKVTAISGGSNMASGWSISRTTRFQNQSFPGDGSPNPAGGPVPTPSDVLRPWASEDDTSAMTPQEEHLLLNLGYLVANQPRGDQSDPAIGGTVESAKAGTKNYVPTAYATVFTGFLANTAVLLLVMWVVARPLGWLVRWLSQSLCGPVAAAPGPFEPTPSLSGLGSLLLGLDSGSGGSSPAETAPATCVAGDPATVWPGVVWVLIGLVGVVLWVLISKVLGRRALAPAGKPWQRFFLTLRGIGYGGLALGLVLLFVLVALPYLMKLFGGLETGQVSLASVVGVLGTIASVGRILRKPAARFAPMIGGVLFFVVIVFLSAYWANGASTSEPRWDSLSSANAPWWWLLAILALLVVHVAFSPELWALAPFYRGKLRLAYANYATGPGQPVVPYKNDDSAQSRGEMEPPLFSYVQRGAERQLESDYKVATGAFAGTPLTVCATATTTTRAIRTHYGIPAMSLTFDPQRVSVFVPVNDQGSWGSYTCRTESIDTLTKDHRKRITTMMAVAISSAAVSPAMGRFRPGPTSMLLTFANVRLGVWLPNPRYVKELEQPDGTIKPGLRYPNTRLGYLAKEFFGIHDFSDPYLYMTDGGHWENTGIVEMLRSGTITELVAIDADLGAGDAIRSVSQAIDLAMLECGVQIDIDLDPLRATVAHTNAPDYSARAVNVGFYTYQNGRVGVLWYSKPALTKDMPAALLAYRETHADYPRISTVDQFFDTSTFVAYRGLGRHNAKVIRDARTTLVETMAAASAAPGPDTEFQRFCAVVDQLDGTPDDHWVCGELIRAAKARYPYDEEKRNTFYAGVKAALL